MILWLDDIRCPPSTIAYVKNYGSCSYEWIHSVNEAIEFIEFNESLLESENYMGPSIVGIDLDHDLGEFAKDGGDGIKLLDWLEERGLRYRIRLHTMNPVGRQNMEAVIKKNGWRKLEYK